MFITKSGKECRNIQEQVEWNLEQIEKIKEQLENVGQLYIEIDDSQSIGSGTLGEDDLNKLKENAYVAVLMQRAEDVYIQFNAGSYIEQNTMIKSMSAGGYFRKLDIDLDTGDWTLTESNEDISALSDQVAELQRTVEEIPEVSVSEEISESAPTGKSITIGENTYNFPSSSNPTIEITRLPDQFTGTITQEQWDTIFQNNSKIILHYFITAAIEQDTFEFYKATRYEQSGEQPLIFFTIKNNVRYTLTISNSLAWTLEFEEVPAVSGNVDEETDFWTGFTIGNESHNIPENIVLNPEVPSGTEIFELEYIKKGNKYYQIPSGSGEPSSYIKSISQSGNSITWTDQDDNTHTFTVDFSGYYSSTQVDNLLANKQNKIDSSNKLPYTHVSGTPTDLPVSVLTEAPTSAYTGGGAKIVHLASSTGVTEYNGYIYMYDED